MNVVKINPENAMLSKSDGQWCKFLALTMSKLRMNEIVFEREDVEYLQHMFDHETPTIVVSGKDEMIVLNLVSESEGERIAEKERKSQ